MEHLAMKSSFALLVTCSLVAFPALATAADGGWQMPNPFAKKASPPTSRRVSDSSGSGWKMPSLWPAKKTTTSAARKPAQPSTWQKMTTSTKQFWSTTADTINPFNDADDKPQQPISVTGTNTYFSQAANRKTTKTKSKSFLPSWRSGEEETPARENTGGVNDFLSQPRPGF
jgi:hypothetical protein